MIKVLVADDDPFIRESLKVIIGLDPELRVDASCANGLEATAYVREHPDTDLVLMDIRMPECDGVEGTRLLKALERPPAVLILTTFDDDEYILQALRNGANGYLLKNVPPAAIVAGIKSVVAGHHLIHPDIARKLAELIDSRSRPSARPEELRELALAEAGLTPAERQIVRLIAEGMSNREIAAALFFSEGTVKNYITEVLGKLALRDRTQLAIYYLKIGSRV